MLYEDELSELFEHLPQQLHTKYENCIIVNLEFFLTFVFNLKCRSATDFKCLQSTLPDQR